MPLKGFKLGKVELILDQIIHLTIFPRKNGRPICPLCGKKDSTYDTQKPRTWRHLSCFKYHILIEFAPRRVQCKHCHTVVTEAIPWSIGKCHLTKPLLYQLALWARELSWSQVARLFEVDWSQVKTAVASAVQFGLKQRDTSEVLLIGIDEISRQKGHKYLTQVYEIAEGKKRLLWSGKDRSEDTLRKFFHFWGEERSKKLLGICCDMWNPYIKVIREFAPQAVIVFDKFHIVRHLNNAVDEVRRKEAAELQKQGNRILNKTRYIWLKNPENLTAKQKILFHQLAAKDLKTLRAYELKRAFQLFWDCPDRKSAEIYFQQWFNWSTHSKLEQFQELAWRLYLEKEQILSYFSLPITNNAVEGMNNKAKVIMRRSYGFHTTENCILSLMHCMGKLDLPDFDPQIHK